MNISLVGTTDISIFASYLCSTRVVVQRCCGRKPMRMFLQREKLLPVADNGVEGIRTLLCSASEETDLLSGCYSSVTSRFYLWWTGMQPQHYRWSLFKSQLYFVSLSFALFFFLANTHYRWIFLFVFVFLHFHRFLSQPYAKIKLLTFNSCFFYI